MDILVEDLKNIGPKTAAWLQEIGIYTKRNLVDIGPVMAFKILQHRFNGINTLALYALYGAIHDVHWNSIPPETKDKLRKEANSKLDVDVD